jgi:hypothetical protein
MPIEVEKTIPVDSRNTLVRNRDALQDKYDVKIYFPRNRVRGAFQDMIIKGGVNGTTNAGRDIDHILVSWRQEFEDFKQRQAYRKSQRQVASVPPYFPSVAESGRKSTSKTTSNNRFALLETTRTNDEPSLPTVVKHKTNTLTGWASVAAKAPVKQKEPELPKKFTFGSTGSKAVFQYVEPQRFDWAEVAAEEDEREHEEDTDDWAIDPNMSWADM